MLGIGKKGNRTFKLGEVTDRLMTDVISDERSVIRGGREKSAQAVTEWLKDEGVDPESKACLLNVLAKLRMASRPELPRPLLAEVDFVFGATQDRVYVACQPSVEALLDYLVEAGDWTKDSGPIASIHYLLKAAVVACGYERDVTEWKLTSYRQGGFNSLQVVLLKHYDPLGSVRLYADVDIDLANPGWDLVRLFTHLGELLNPAPTDHLALYRRLKKGTCKDYLCYEVTNG